ncbi:hypothetical protein HR45_09555 [Shewanella mangrovi]|uniref:Uncharacterized protein n=2 Tax=Shewanella mangrovi TaxID=1515746 RepID=A0A094JHZ8_9GAMM|nr:hypothetical protein HR45_09555 [Shewanella mangrovi]
MLFSLLFLGLLVLALPVLFVLSLVLLTISLFVGRQRVSSFALQIWQSYRPRNSRYRDIYRRTPHVERDSRWPNKGRVFEHQD